MLAHGSTEAVDGKDSYYVYNLTLQTLIKTVDKTGWNRGLLVVALKVDRSLWCRIESRITILVWREQTAKTVTGKYTNTCKAGERRTTS